MPDRNVREGLITSERWAGLRQPTQNLFVRLLLAADDFGTFPANPAIIRARCYPLELGRIREADLPRWLDEIEQAGLIRYFDATSGRYLTILRYGQAQRMKHPRARYPRPEAGGAPDVPGQEIMPFVDEDTPRPPQRPSRAALPAPAPEKRREEKSPHSPPPAGGGIPPRRFRTAERRAARIEQIGREIAAIKTEMQDLYYPGGCATKVMPTGAKAEKADTLRARWDALETERDALENTPENTGG